LVGFRADREKKTGYPQISQMDADFRIPIGEIGVICGSPLPLSIARNLILAREFSIFDLEVSLRHDPESAIQTWSSKVRTGFEGAHPFREVRILENPGDFFEDAHLFPRCARKLRIFERRTARTRAPALGRGRVQCSETLRNPRAIPILNARINRRLSRPPMRNL
jgi:hypothetical protein